MTRLFSADAVVVGGGVVGAAIAHRLAVVGLGRIVVCEQGRTGAGGATSRSGGLLRLHHTAPADTRLAALSLPVFQQWDDVIGGDCGYRRTGFMMLVGSRHAEALRVNSAATAEAAGWQRTEVIDPAEARLLYPGLDTRGVGAVAYEPDGGYADPVATTHCLLRAARRLGVTEAEGLRVERIVENDGAVTGIDTSMGRVDTPLVVLANGAWAGPLAAGIGVRIPVVARRIGLARARLPGVGRRGSDAAVPTCVDDTTGCYFRPDGLDRVYFGVPSDPDAALTQDVAPLTSGEVQAAAATVSRRVPAVAHAELTGTRAGLDGYTPDRRPAIGPAGPDGLYLAIGFSGGGFKTAPAVAELAAREICEGGAVVGKAPQRWLEPYRPQRFHTGGLITARAPYDHM